MSHRTTKPTKWHVRPAKTQISLSIRPVWWESSLCAPRIAEDPRRLQADSEYSDQNGRMPRLTWVFAGRLSFCWFCHAAAHMYIQLTKSVITLSRGLVPEEDCGLWLWHYLDFFFFMFVSFERRASKGLFFISVSHAIESLLSVKQTLSDHLLYVIPADHLLYVIQLKTRFASE